MLDFDGTITQKDTIETLVQFIIRDHAIHSRSASLISPPPHQTPLSEPRPKFSQSLGPSFNSDGQRSKSPPDEDFLPPPIREMNTSKAAQNPVRTVKEDPRNSPVMPSETSHGAASLVSTPSLVSATLQSSLLNIWQYSISEPYFKDIEKHRSEYMPSEYARHTWEEEEEYLESLRPVDEASVKRMESSPLLRYRSLHHEDFRRFGRKAVRSSDAETAEDASKDPTASPSSLATRSGKTELPIVELRRGFEGFLRKAAADQWQLGLVSVNWSQSFIEGVLGADDHIIGNNLADSFISTKMGASPEIDVDSRASNLANAGERFTMLANHITRDGKIDGPPGWNGPMTTAGDKARAFRQLKKSLPSRRSVYIGDSATDLLCLREADLGIVMADEPHRSSLVKTLGRLGMFVLHVTEATTPPPLTQMLVWARDFSEILESGILDRLSEKGQLNL